MALTPVNLGQALESLREQWPTPEDQLLMDAWTVLDQAIEEEQALRARIIMPHPSAPQEPMVLPKTLAHDLFSEDAIKALCGKYRLRFLPARRFKSEIPHEGIRKTLELERTFGLRFERFLVVAPETMFELCDRLEDPILFADAGGGRYLRIHQWGHDMSFWRSIRYMPFRNLFSFVHFTFIVSALIALLAPKSLLVNQLFMGDNIWSYRVMLFSCCVTWISVITVYLGMLHHKNFNEADWRNPYFN